MKEAKRKSSAGVAVYIVLLIGAVMMIFPFAWMIVSSLKTYQETIQIPPSMLPEVMRWDNYSTLFGLIPFAKLYANTIIVTLVITLGQTFIAAMAAYSFARLDFPLKNVLFFLLLSVLMVPGQVFYLPQYLTIQAFGLQNTLRAIFLPGLFSAYGTFLLRQFFMSLPVELEEAATIDGCGRLRVFFSIALPLAKSGLISLCIFAMLFGWNDLLWPMLIISSPDKMTLAPGLSLLQGQHVTKHHLLMAGAFMGTIPVLAIFFLFQKQFIEGIAITGIKG